MSKELCLVTGGTGTIGPRLIRQLTNDGYAVRALVHRTPDEGLFPPGVDISIGDINDRESIERAIQGSKIVFHLAAKAHITNPGPELRDLYRRVNVEGTRNLIEACSGAGVERVIYFSSVSVYGDTHGAWIDEDSLPHPEGIYGETKLAGEKIVLAPRGPNSQPPLAVVLRCPAIYGPRMKGSYPMLLKALDHGLFFLVGPGNNRCTLVHEQDAARAAILAARHPNAPGRIFNVTDGRAYALHDIIVTICTVLGRNPPKFYVPTRLSCVMTRVVDGVAGLAGRRLDLTMLVEKFVRDIAIRGERIQEELGFRPLVGLDEGWRQAIAAWRTDNSPSKGAAN